MKTEYIEDLTQEQKILKVLEAKINNWVPLTDILKLGVAQYNARIWGLRKKGYTIENKIEIQKNKKRHTFFKLVTK
ncbi:hypothetical protein BKN14_00295 [Candidatus Gracilibacteria bacterium HOT-871]|nr:hypothetical protein BKN14_00295 [Candidatus Gracilibacteria bacterium HOT-871]